MLTIEKKYEYLKKAMILGLFLGYAFFVYRNFRISGLYMDDLYMWSFYGEQSFIEYVFPLHSIRFRPVYWFVAWVQLGIIGNNITWIVPMNIIIAALIAYYIYHVAVKLSGSNIVSVFLGLIFLSSRFAYYNISQLLGLMEAMCIVFVIAILSNLYSYIEEGKNSFYYKALLYYLLICFTHERFMVLIPVLIFARIVGKSKEKLPYLYTLLVFIFIQAVRAFTIGTILPAGTGNTEVVDKFTIKSFISFLMSSIGYMFGINAGPEHLNGIPWGSFPTFAKVFVYIGIFIAIIIFIYYIISLGFIKKHKNLFYKSIMTSIIFILMIGGSLISGSVTIRVEMRWIYAPYALMLLFIANMYMIIAKTINMKLHAITPEKELRILNLIPIVVVIMWGFCILPIEILTYKNMYKIYLFPNQKRYNSLADETYGKYKDKLFEKEIYIIGNTYDMKEFTANTFFKVFDKERMGRTVPVKHIESIKEIGQIEPNMIILKEDVANDLFTEATDIYRDMKCEIVKGYYRDGWLEEEAEINVMAGASGEVKLEFMYPGEINGKQVMNISVDSGQPEQIDIEENITEKVYKTKPFGIMNLKFANDFYLPDAKEQRSDRKLSIIMNISSN